LIWCGIAEIQHHRASPCLGAVWCVDSACRTSPPLSSYGTMKQVCNPLINTVSSSDLSLESPLSSASSWYGMPAPFTACRLASSWDSTRAPRLASLLRGAARRRPSARNNAWTPQTRSDASPPLPEHHLPRPQSHWGRNGWGKVIGGREERNGIAPRVCR